MQLKLYSWNVNGLRACLKKGFLDFIKEHQPDILCLQETKAKREQVVLDLPEYQEIWHSAKRPGYSGTAIFTKIKPLSTSINLHLPSTPLNSATQTPTILPDRYGDPLSEGRIQTAEFEHFYLVNVYTPNSKSDLSRLDFRYHSWDPGFLAYLKQLENNKPVIFCGDLNAAHQDIDLARPKQNRKNAGFTDQERQGITNIINSNFIDTFRALHPNKIQYTWWSHYANARKNNVGWRIDYFFLSQSLKRHLISAAIHDQIIGSDHCPISISLNFET